jgi:hypothetical protein
MHKPTNQTSGRITMDRCHHLIDILLFSIVSQPFSQQTACFFSHQFKKDSIFLFLTLLILKARLRPLSERF